MGRGGVDSGLATVRGSISYRVVPYEEAVTLGARQPIGSAWDEGEAYDSYLIAERSDGTVELLFSDSLARYAPEDMTFGRGLAFLKELLFSLGEQAGRKFLVLPWGNVVDILGSDSDEERNSQYLCEEYSDGGLNIMWAEHYAQWAPEDCTLARDFSFVVPLLNELSS